MKIIVIGAVAAGTSAAAKARRNDDHAQITIYEKDKYISYSGCGMPYFIGGKTEGFDTITPRDAQFFKKKYNIDIHIEHEVLKIDKDKKTVEVKNLVSGEIFHDSYDKLVISTGASVIKPNIKGSELENVFYLRSPGDALKIKNFIDAVKPKKAVVAGTGFVGLEMLENLVEQGIDTTVIEIKDKITPNLDPDMAKILENRLIKKGVKILKSTSIIEVCKDGVELSNNEKLDCELVILATGVRPNTALAVSTGVELGITGAIKVDKNMKTNIEDIYACGDCIETFMQITNKPIYRPLGSTANKTGRITGDNITGVSSTYKGNLGTGIFKVFDIAVASTGLSEEEAMAEGYDIEICHNIKPDKPQYMGGKELIIKAIANREDGRILGAQIIGYEGVDKRIDVLVTLITYKATVDELFDLDLAYAPPFSTTKDPIHYTGMILDNAINKSRPVVTSKNLSNLNGAQLIDARSVSDFENKGTVENAVNIPHAKLRKELESLDKAKPTVTFCNKGVTGNAAQNILLGNGFNEVYNLSGGHKFYKESK